MGLEMPEGSENAGMAKQAVVVTGEVKRDVGWDSAGVMGKTRGMVYNLARVRRESIRVEGYTREMKRRDMI